MDDHRRRFLPATLLALALALAPPAAARVVTSPNGRRFSIEPTLQAGPSKTSCTNSCTTTLTYHNGPVQHASADLAHAVTQYLIFWAPSGHYMPPSYRNGLSVFFTDLSATRFTATNVFSLNNQYYDTSGAGGTKRFVPNSLRNGGTIVDTKAFPASGCTDHDGAGGPTTATCLTDAQVQAEIQSVVTSHELPQNANTQYFLFMPRNAGSCFDSSSSDCAYTDYCGYHDFFTGSGGEIVYAAMPWLFRRSGCDLDFNGFNAGYANGSAIDPIASVISHEASEMLTDPHLNAWFDSSGFENGDKCAFQFGSGGYESFAGVPNNGIGFYNQVINADQYLLQLEYSNFNLDCKSKATDTQPVFTVTTNPAAPVHGSSTTFNVNVTTAVGGVNEVFWTFGDGLFATTKTTSATHTYGSAGTFTARAVVTDQHGNQKRVDKTVTVS